VKEGWKVLTHNGRLPAPGSPQVWDGTIRTGLPPDRQGARAGWSFQLELTSALRTSGLWPIGRPSVVVRVSVPVGQCYSHGETAYAPALLIERRATEEEVVSAIGDLSEMFNDYKHEMMNEQLAWRIALSRPTWDAATVASALREALCARSLGSWRLQRLASPALAWRAWAEWAAAASLEALTARDDWGFRYALRAKREWFLKSVGATWKTWDPWTTTDAEYVSDATTEQFQIDLCAARAAYSANFALTLGFASCQQWLELPPDLLTRGIRRAYEYGLGVALPISPRTLGWAMVERE
jgi:hypothetical protein